MYEDNDGPDDAELQGLRPEDEALCYALEALNGWEICRHVVAKAGRDALAMVQHINATPDQAWDVVARDLPASIEAAIEDMKADFYELAHERAFEAQALDEIEQLVGEDYGEL